MRCGMLHNKWEILLQKLRIILGDGLSLFLQYGIVNYAIYASEFQGVTCREKDKASSF